MKFQSDGKRRLDWLLVLAVSMALVSWRYSIPDLTMDGVTYLQIVRNLLSGEGLGWQALWASPGYPLVIAGIAWLFNIKDLLYVVSLVGPAIYLALIMVVYFFTDHLFDRRAALVASILTAFSPHLMAVTFSPEPELLFTCIQLGGLYLLFTALKRRSTIPALLSGVLFSFAWLSRSEGLLVMLFALSSLLIVERRRWRETRAIHICFAIMLAFMFTAAPYLYFLQKNYGRIVLSPKTSYVMIWMKIGYGDSEKEELHNDDLWGLTTDGRLKWQVPKGIGDLVAYLASHPAKSAKTYLGNLSYELPGRIPNNSGMENYPQLFPIYLAMAAVVGAFHSVSRNGNRNKWLLISPLLMLLVLPVFTPGWWKYLIPYLPLVLILAAIGIVRGSEFVVSRVPAINGPRAIFVVPLLTMAIAGRFLWPYVAVSQKTKTPATVAVRHQTAHAQKMAGEWARSTFGEGHRYSMPWSKLIYYLDGYWVASPMADYSSQLSYLRRHRAEFVVNELTGDEALLDNSSNELAPPGLELAGTYQAPDIAYRAVFYRVLMPGT